MNIDWQALSQLGPGVIAVVVFCLFTLAMVDRQEAHNKRRDAEATRERKERNDSWIQAIKDINVDNQAAAEKRDAVYIDASKDRDVAWHTWQIEERDYHAGSMGRMAEEIKMLAASVNASNALLAAHDAFVRGQDRGG